jgi:protease I
VSGQLDGIRVAIVVANEGVEQIELERPRDALEKAGASIDIVAPEVGKVEAMNHLDKGDTFQAAQSTSDVSAADYDALLLPGGVANRDRLRTYPAAVSFVRSMFEAGKPAAVICHGPWTLVEADVVRGRTLTSWPSLQTDIRNAGGTWVDEEVQVCRGGNNVLITSRNPGDLAAFCGAATEAFQTVPARS